MRAFRRLSSYAFRADLGCRRIRDVFDRVVESKALLAGDLAGLPAFEGLLAS